MWSTSKIVTGYSLKLQNQIDNIYGQTDVDAALQMTGNSMKHLIILIMHIGIPDIISLITYKFLIAFLESKQCVEK